jgi:REP element-mobilizing transposase RayT
MLPPNPLMNTIIESAMARAQALHPVRICHYLFESNHFHMIAIVDNPDDIKGFLERFKTETAHAINRLLGRRKRTIWCKGYDSPTLLTLQDAIKRIVYLYINPAKDNLVKSVSEHPGLSSWRSFTSGTGRGKTCPRVTRDMLFALKRHTLTRRQYAGLARHLRKKAQSSHTLTLSPDAWMEAFRVEDPKEKARINQDIIERVKERELEFEKTRQKDRKEVMGAEYIMLQPMNTPYLPERKGRKMWCICQDKDLRKKFIRTARGLAQRAREVFEMWKTGDFSVLFPPGLFPPCMPKLMEPLTLC